MQKRDLPVDTTHQLPQAVDIETQVLGAALSNLSAGHILLTLLKDKEIFYDERHQWVYQAMRDLASTGETISTITIINQLKKLGVLARVGGPGFVAGLAMEVDFLAKQEEYCRILQQEYSRRTIIHAGRELAAYAADYTRDSLELLTSAQTKLTSLHRTLESRPGTTVAGYLDETIAQLSRAVQACGLTGVPTGLSELDKLTGGWQPSDLIIIAARPGMGKTMALLHFARTAALEHEQHVAFFSLEMSKLQLMQRLLASEIPGYSTSDLRCGRLTGGLDEVAHIAQQAQRLRASGHHLHLDDTAGITINQLRAKCVQLHAQWPLSLILVDYVQLMHGENSKYTSREREVSSISQGLKELAKELNVPVIALAQLSREVERRGGDKRPMPSDLRESGSLEQDADCIIFLWRGEAYNIAEYADGTSTAGTMLLDIAKHRNGAVDHIIASCDLKRSRLEDLATW